MFGISVVPAILLAVGMAMSPESPRWLYQVSINHELLLTTIHYFLVIHGCTYSVIKRCVDILCSKENFQRLRELLKRSMEKIE